jgi:hypothetical protein
MPCWGSRVYNPPTVEDFNKADFDILFKAAVAIGGTQTYVDIKNRILQFRHNAAWVEVSGGKITVQQGQEATIQALNKSYTKEVFKAAASKYKMQLDVKGDDLTLKWRY